MWIRSRAELNGAVDILQMDLKEICTMQVGAEVSDPQQVHPVLS